MVVLEHVRQPTQEALKAGSRLRQTDEEIGRFREEDVVKVAHYQHGWLCCTRLKRMQKTSVSQAAPLGRFFATCQTHWHVEEV